MKQHETCLLLCTAAHTPRDAANQHDLEQEVGGRVGLSALGVSCGPAVVWVSPG